VATCPPDIKVSKGNSSTSPAAGVVDPDLCDGKVWSLVSVNPAPCAGNVSVNPATGAVTFDSDVCDAVGGADTDYEICLEVTDGIDVDQCCMTFTVLNTEPFCISIEQTDKDENLNTLPGTLQGHQEEICIVYDAGSNEIGGFDFLISYDNSVLSLVGATEGSIYADYEWEYFTYRYGPNGNCNGGCPSGKVRIVGLAEQNDGMHHPNNLALVPGDTFACLTFLVSNDRNYGCQFAPIRWCWLDCGDNALSSGGGDTTYISNEVYDYIGTDNANVLHEFRADITGADPTFPTLTGAPDECDVRTEKGAPIRFVCFENGGIKIICPDDIDDRGDVNLNGLSNEIADAVMFTEYFISGLSAFVPHIEGSIAATEVNGDGIPLTVADLVYLIRVIVGDALPLPKSVHNTASITVAGNVVSTNVDLGAALFVFEGTANVELLATNMDMKVGVVDGNTHALVYSISTNSIAAGGVVSADANLLSVEAASYEGVALDVITDVLPTEFAVYQNYPNPFNPSTKIGFDLPTPAAYQVSIYNVAGQLVDVINGENVGKVVVEWDAASMASGVYFYKVEALGLSMTKKMMLLK
ncbi:MAG TPA: T9SS type A sorting domain-containing protein, partial [candidate division Zixibacteria bacterium]|nr:T9SS type A sorting domain-containing protein [candidate division Zixibacteria bacterium]